MKVSEGDIVYDIVRGKGVVTSVSNVIAVEFLTWVPSVEYFGRYDLNGVPLYLAGRKTSTTRTLYKLKKYNKIMRVINKLNGVKNEK